MEKYKISDNVFDNGDYVVYKICNTINDSCYIGHTSSVGSRIKGHFDCLKRNKHHSKTLQQDFNKFGESVFEFIILRRFNDSDEAKKSESDFLKTCNPIYNSNGKILRAEFSEIDLLLQKIESLSQRVEKLEFYIKTKLRADKSDYYPVYDVEKLKKRTRGRLINVAKVFNVRPDYVRRVLNGKSKHLAIITYLIEMSKKSMDMSEVLENFRRKEENNR